MKYGSFSPDGNEFIIEQPDTPKPWFNYLFNERYHAVISQTGGGFSYARDPKFNRILNYENYSSDRPGRYLFLFDRENRDFWSANWQPLCQPLDAWKCIHGFGYSKIFSRHREIEAEITYFVPLEQMGERMLIRITNVDRRERTIDLFPFYDVVAGDISLELLYPNIMPLYNRSYFDPALNALVLYKMPTSTRAVESFIVMSSSQTVSGYDSSREKFLGRYGSLAAPESVQCGQCKNSVVNGERMVAVLQNSLQLAPGESRELTISLHFIDDESQYEIFQNPHFPFSESHNAKEKIAEMVNKDSGLASAKAELKAIRQYWKTKFPIQVRTPDENFDLMVNHWLQYQLVGITLWRGSSPYHGAEGGLGYRDTAQDIEGLLSLDLPMAKKKLAVLLSYQYQNGHAVTGFSDIEGPWDNHAHDMITGKSDVAVWLVYTVISYLKETGDFAFLDAEYPFVDGGQATVKEHILRAVRHLFNHVGSHSLPLIGKADWNDAYDRIGAGGKGESVWLAMALARALQQCIELFSYLKEPELEKEMREKYEQVAKTVNEVAWDGQWYLAAFTDQQRSVGAAEYAEGQMPLNSQTWAILSNIASGDRLKSLLNIIDSELETPYGPVLFKPAFSKYQHDLGRVTAFAEGTKENAAVFSHAGAFKVVADCHLGRGDKAFQTFMKLLPTNPRKAGRIDQYRAEPYVVAEYIIGPEHPSAYGRGEFTWNTGTVPWLYAAATEWIVGARRSFEGLLIDPCLPRHWNVVEITRPFRGDVFVITIENPENVEKGVVQVWLDGQKHPGNLIKPIGDGKTHFVKVLMGKIF